MAPVKAEALNKTDPIYVLLAEEEVRPTSGSSSGDVNKKSKGEHLLTISEIFIGNSDSESSDSEEVGEEQDDSEKPHSKLAKLDSVEGEIVNQSCHS